jgi:hypothetical protein
MQQSEMIWSKRLVCLRGPERATPLDWPVGRMFQFPAVGDRMVTVCHDTAKAEL